MNGSLINGVPISISLARLSQEQPTDARKPTGHQREFATESEFLSKPIMNNDHHKRAGKVWRAKATTILSTTPLTYDSLFLPSSEDMEPVRRTLIGTLKAVQNPQVIQDFLIANGI